MNASIVLKLLDGVTGPIRKVQQSIANASKQFEHFSEKADKAFERAEHIKLAGEGVKEFAEKARDVVEKLTQPFEQLEQGLNRVEAATGANKEVMEEVEAAARKVGATGRASATEAAGALEIMATSGFKVNDAMDSLGTMLDRAKVQNVSLAEATISATDTAKEFGLTLESNVLTHLNDLTAKMALASGTSFSNMNAALLMSGVAANAAGVSVERTTQLIGLLATKGIQGANAGDALTLMFKNLNNASVQKNISEASNGMVKMTDAAGDLRDPLAILTDLTADMTRRHIKLGVQTAYLNSLFPKSAVKIRALIAASKQPGMEKLNKALKDVAGTTKNMADEDMKNGIAKTKEMLGAFDNLATSIGKTMAPALNVLKDIVIEVATSVTNFLDENPKLAHALGFTALAIAAVSTVMAGLFTVVTTIVSGAGLYALAAGMWAITAPMLVAAAPFLAVAAAIGAVALAVSQLVKAWDTLDASEAWKGIKDALGDGSFLNTMTLNPFSGMGSKQAETFQPQGGAAANGSVDVNVNGPATATVGKGSTGLNLSVDPRAGVPMMSGG